MIDPNCLYTTQECMALCRMGEQTLCEARLAGIVTPIQVGRVDYYVGAELIDFVKRVGRRKARPNRKNRTERHFDPRSVSIP